MFGTLISDPRIRNIFCDSLLAWAIIIAAYIHWQWRSWPLYLSLFSCNLARTIGVPVGCHSGSWLARQQWQQWTVTIPILFSILHFLFSLLWLFPIEGVLRSKHLFCESWGEHPKTLGLTCFQTPYAILGPLAAILDYWGSHIRKEQIKRNH